MMNWKRFWIQGLLGAVMFGSLGLLANIDVTPIGEERINTTETTYQEMMGNETSSMER